MTFIPKERVETRENDRLVYVRVADQKDARKRRLHCTCRCGEYAEGGKRHVQEKSGGEEQGKVVLFQHSRVKAGRTSGLDSKMHFRAWQSINQSLFLAG